MRVRTIVRPKGSKTVDPVTGQRLLNASWLAASFGSATLQLRLFAQALPALQAIGASRYLGTGIAVLALVWLLGARLGRVSVMRCSPAGWGAWLLASTLGWLLVPALGVNPALPLPPGLLQLAACGLLSALLALFSAAWLAHERPWPKVGEGTSQVAAMSAILFGLAVTWRFPEWSGAVGCALLLPLLLVDLCPVALCPRAGSRSALPPFLTRPRAARGTADPDSTRRALQLPMRAGWWWAWLARRGQLSQTLLGSGVMLTCLSVWSVMPTLYALELARSHDLDVLFWLLGGQLAAYLVGAALLLTRKGLRLFRASALPMALDVRRLAFSVEWCSLGVVALGLTALGNPWQQDPWFLALALFGYTLAFGAWNRVHVRLLASHAPAAEPRYLPWTVQAAVVDDLAGLRLRRDELARRSVARWEMALLVVAIALTGAFGDAWGVDPVFMLAGCVLVASLGVALIAMSSAARPTQQVVEYEQQGDLGLSAAQETMLFAGEPGAEPSGLPRRATTTYTAGERSTTAQHALLLPQIAGEQTDSEAGRDSAPLPLASEEDGERGGRGNGHAMH